MESAKICLITGGSSGIGKALGKEAVKSDYNVILISGNYNNLISAKKEISDETGKVPDIYKVDLSLQKEIREFSEMFIAKYPQLDILINNAGVNLPNKIISSEGFEYIFAVNHLAPFLLTNLLLDKLKKTGRSQVINIVSNGEKFAKFDHENLQAEKSFNGTKHYCLTKLCNLMFSYELSFRTKEWGITSNAIHPGGVKTNIINSYKWYSLTSLVWKIITPTLQTPDDIAKKIFFLINSEIFLKENGKYFFKDKIASSSPGSYNREHSGFLWDLSRKLTGM